MKITQSLLSWRSFHGKNIHSPLRSCAWTFLLSAAAILTLLFSTASSSFAGSATWKASPATGDWNTAANWTAGGPPNGSADTATFASSSITGISISASTEVNGTVFNAGASAFTITADAASLTISGVGITNNSLIMQNFVAGVAGITFTNSATAGSLTAFTSNRDLFFFNTSTAGDATFTNNFLIDFGDSSTAGNGAFINNNSGEIAFESASTAGNAAFTINGGSVQFNNGTPTAGNGIFTINGGGGVQFGDASTAGNATLIANGVAAGGGGTVFFSSSSLGGAARVEVFGNGTGDSTNGNLDISSHGAPGVTIGSIEGSGAVFLGANNLTVGANNLSTTFSGLIQDGSNGSGGSLRKIGRGKLTLSKASTYTGGTTISKGTLIAKNKTGSATGTGAVQVNSGTLSGTGKISGAVTVGNGTTAGAILQPGIGSKRGMLTINNTVSFNATSAFKWNINRISPPVGATLNALGVTIGSNVTFTLVETSTTTLTAGTVFTVINNTSANPISGHFSNLPDGGTITSVNGTVYKANYSGGTGNDLTLTVQ